MEPGVLIVHLRLRTGSSPPFPSHVPPRCKHGTFAGVLARDETSARFVVPSNSMHTAETGTRLRLAARTVAAAPEDRSARRLASGCCCCHVVLLMILSFDAFGIVGRASAAAAAVPASDADLRRLVRDASMTIDHNDGGSGAPVAPTWTSTAPPTAASRWGWGRAGDGDDGGSLPITASIFRRNERPDRHDVPFYSAAFENDSDDDDDGVDDETLLGSGSRHDGLRRSYYSLYPPWVRRNWFPRTYDDDDDGSNSINQRRRYYGPPTPLVGSSPAARSPPVTLRSTGTTIAGVVVVLEDGNHSEEDGADGNKEPATPRTRRRMAVVLGSDTRATAGSLVADKNASKIHPLAANLYACGAGTSADLIHLARQARYTFRWISQSQFETVGNANRTEALPRRGDGSDGDESTFVNVIAACRWLQDALYSQGGTCQANLIVGGIIAGSGAAVLRAIHPHGSMDEDLPYAALGSGGLAAMSVLESRYRPNLTLEEAVQLVKDAIRAGIRNDLGSGSAIDLCVLESDAQFATHIRSAVPEETACPRSGELINENIRCESPQSDGSAEDRQKEKRFGFDVGVNGFGNVPLTIRTVRTIQVFEEENELESDWDEILGISRSGRPTEHKS